MGSKIGTLALLSITLLLSPLSAQSVRMVKVSVPFAFTARNHNLPPGDYTISINDDPDTLRISGAHTAVPVIIGYVQSSGKLAASKRIAMFTQGNEGYILHKVWIEARCLICCTVKWITISERLGGCWR